MMAVFNRNFPMNNPTGGDWGPSSSHAERSFRDVVAVRLDNVKAELANLPTFRATFGEVMQSKKFLCSALGLVDGVGYTVLHHAAAHGAGAFVSLLFDIAAVVHANLSSAQLSALTDRREPKRGLAPIHFAVMNRHRGVVSALLNSGHASPNIPDFDGRSPLHMAVDNQDVDMVRMLLEFGANPNQADVEGATPLHEACATGNAGIVCLLLQNGAHADAKDHEGEEPVFYAVREHQVDVVKILVAYGCEVWKCVNEDGESPLDLSVAVRDFQMSKFLRDSFAFPAIASSGSCDVSQGNRDEELMDVDQNYSTQFGSQVPCI